MENWTKGPGMLRRSFLLLCMILSSLTMASALHAREIPGSEGLECSGEIHTDDQQDKSQGDPGKAVQHHGHCHMGSAVVPLRTAENGISFKPPVVLPVMSNAGLGRWIRGPGLRPPIV